ncbi:hypothetical protein ACIA8C_19565 [Nocardia sp. NPDC051321]|uniref:hypothetical protein n=1 Tax=Nocardia sp. NPDC051321 TaxID=3364323 RepID=UPI0037BA1320
MTFEDHVQRITAKAGRAGYGLRRKNRLSHEWALFGASGHDAVVSGSLDELETWLAGQRMNISTDRRSGATVLRLAPTERPYAGSDEDKEAGTEFRCAVTAWEEAGEPQSGPILERLGAARERFLSAQRCAPVNGKDQP